MNANVYKKQIRVSDGDYRISMKDGYDKSDYYWDPQLKKTVYIKKGTKVKTGLKKLPKCQQPNNEKHWDVKKAIQKAVKESNGKGLEDREFSKRKYALEDFEKEVNKIVKNVNNTGQNITRKKYNELKSDFKFFFLNNMEYYKSNTKKLENMWNKVEYVYRKAKK